MRYVKHTVGGGWKADEELLKFLNQLPASHRVVHVQKGRYGVYHGLNEAHEAGYMIVVDTHGSETNG